MKTMGRAASNTALSESRCAVLCSLSWSPTQA